MILSWGKICPSFSRRDLESPTIFSFPLSAMIQELPTLKIWWWVRKGNVQRVCPALTPLLFLFFFFSFWCPFHFSKQFSWPTHSPACPHARYLSLPSYLPILIVYNPPVCSLHVHGYKRSSIKVSSNNTYLLSLCNSLLIHVFYSACPGVSVVVTNPRRRCYL